MTTNAHALLPELPGVYCCVYCEHARRLRNPPSIPTPDYLAAKARLQVATTDGELDPRRLHGPELAACQARESRQEREKISLRKHDEYDDQEDENEDG